MALIPIMGQPVNLVPNNERAYGCELENPFCTLYKKSADVEDVIMFEMRQTPCAPSIISNGNFADGKDWVADVDVVIAQNKATHVVGVSGQLKQDLSAVLVDNYHQVKVTVTGMSAGNIQIYFTQAGMASATIYANGIYTFYLYDLGDNDNITFVFSADCDGSVSEVGVFGLIDETTAQANATLNTTDGAYVSGVLVVIIDDYIIYRVSTNDLDEGCYQITVIDPCVISGELTDVFESPDFETPSDWNVTSNTPTAFINDIGPPDNNVFWFDVSNPAPQPNLAYASQPFSIPTTNRLYIEFEVNMSALYNDANVYVVLYAADGGDIQEIIRKSYTACAGIGTCTFSTIIPANTLSPSNTDIGIFMEDGSPIGGNVNYIPYAQMRYMEITDESQGIFISNCLKVSTNMGNTKIVEGFADEINNGILGNKSLGFMFLAGYFWLRTRLNLQFSNPHSPIKTENYLYSNGRKKKAYAQVGKAWDLTFHAVDENMHDTIANIINCDRFLIEGNEYITEEKEYTANYGAKGVDPVGESTIEVQKIENTRFNTNV
jgi:hypothetical protein